MTSPTRMTPPPYVLRLFVAGTTIRSQKAIINIRNICDQHLEGLFDLEVIDVYTHPEKTLEHQIVVTPTLVRVTPEPLRRIVGDLSDRNRVMNGLDLCVGGAAKAFA